MAKEILGELVIAYAFISTNKEYMSKQEICRYWNIVDTLLPEGYYTSGSNNSIEDFCDNFPFFVKRINGNNIKFEGDIYYFERRFKLGIPKEIIEVFNIAGTKLEEELDFDILVAPGKPFIVYKDNKEDLVNNGVILKRNDLVNNGITLKERRK